MIINMVEKNMIDNIHKQNHDINKDIINIHNMIIIEIKIHKILKMIIIILQMIIKMSKKENI